MSDRIMAEGKYTFPEGTTSVSSKEMYEAFCKYETVEIPGSVGEVILRINLSRIEYDLKNLILNEGTSSLRACIGRQTRYNIPSSLINIECDGVPSKVVCLQNGFQRAVWCNFNDVEYLQAYTTADIRHCEFKELKHYVYLGEKMKNGGCSPFDDIPDGCVIHVENEKMAKTVLKKCDVFKHYVVVDAAEWKDFPADKLSLTMEEYVPESRILPLQIQMREEKRLEEENVKAIDTDCQLS